MANAEAGNAGELPGELLVWPWTGILATATRDPNDATTLAVLAHELFAGITTTALQEDDAAGHHLHFLVIHFGKSWSGLRGAMSLGFHYVGAGREEWQRLGGGENSGSVFGWAAGQQDLLSDGAVGRFLREAGARARAVEDVEKDEASVATSLGAVVAEYERKAKFLEAKLEETALLASRVEEECSCINGELKELRNLSDNVLPEMNRGVHEENEKLRTELDAVSREIESSMERIQELKDGRTELHCSKVQKLVIEVNSLDMAGREPKTCDHAQMLQEKHKGEMEVISAKVNQLEKQLEQRKRLESVICQLNMKLETGEKLTKEEYQYLYEVMIILKKFLDQEHESLKKSHSDLKGRQQMHKFVIQELRKELIKGFEGIMIDERRVIGIKRMGQLDEKPFHRECKRKFRDDDPVGKAAKLISSWQEELKKTSWRPFITIRADGEDKDVVDEDDPKLKELRAEYGDNICNAVKVALGEFNEYSPQGRDVMNELWNFKEARKATLAEVVKYIFEQLKTSI